MSTYQQVLDALSVPTRRAVFESLKKGPRSVGDIATKLPVSRPAVSQHLKVLKAAGLVWERQDGTRHLYSIDSQGLHELKRYVDQFWDEALMNLKVATEKRARRKG